VLEPLGFRTHSRPVLRMVGFLTIDLFPQLPLNGSCVRFDGVFGDRTGDALACLDQEPDERLALVESSKLHRNIASALPIAKERKGFAPAPKGGELITA